MIKGEFGKETIGVIQFPGYQISGNTGAIGFTAMSDAGGATSPCFEAVLPHVRGYVTKIIASPVTGYAPTGAGNLILKDTFGSSYSYTLPQAGSNDLLSLSIKPYFDGVLRLQIDTLGAASKKAEITIIVQDEGIAVA